MMSNDLNVFLILLSAIMVNNILLIRFIALCSFFGISNSIKTSIGMGMAVTFVCISYNLAFGKSIVYTIGVGVGYLIAIVMFAAIREVVDHAPVPPLFK